MIRKHPRYSLLSVKNMPLTAREQLIYLVDERRYTVTKAVAQGISLLYQAEYVKDEDTEREETP